MHRVKIRAFIDNSIRILIAASKRVLTLYLVLFLLCIMIMNRPSVKKSHQVRNLNEAIPSFDYLVQFSASQGELDRSKLKEYIDYYVKVVEYQPQLAAAHGMLGFCSYYLGRHEEAIIAFSRAAWLNPRFFWFHYNLGLVYFKNEEYKLALNSFKKAITTDVDETLDFINSSKVYKRILWGRRGFDHEIKLRLKYGAHRCYALIVLSNYNLEDFQGVLDNAVYAIENDIDNQDFFYYYAGLAAYKLKRYKGALYYLQGCIDRNPEHAEAIYYFGLTLKELGKKELSEKALQQAGFLKGTNRSLPLFNEDEFVPQIF